MINNLINIWILKSSKPLYNHSSYPISGIRIEKNLFYFESPQYHNRDIVWDMKLDAIHEIISKEIITDLSYVSHDPPVAENDRYLITASADKTFDVFEKKRSN